MKTSKLLITSLLAAASALAVPAFATEYTAEGNVTGNPNGEPCVIGGDSFSENQTLSAGDIVTFNAASGHLHGYYGGTFVADIILGTDATDDPSYNGYALAIHRGSRNTTQTFSGSISGAGNLKIADGNETNSTTYIFTGNVTGLTGNINAESQTSGGLRFGLNGTTASAYSSAASASDGVILNISGTGSITTGNSLVYNYTGGANGETLSVNNTSLTAKTLTFRGGATYTVASTVTGKSTTASDNTLTISAGTTTFTGAVSRFGNVTVESGATLAVGTGGSLDLSGANVTLGSAIANSGTVTLSGTTVFALDNLAATNGTYSLITGNSVTDVSGVSFTRDGSAIKSSRLSVSTASGYAVTVTNYSDLVWAGTAENSAWNTTAENWSSTTAGASVAFENRDSVTFGTDAGVSKTVSVASVVVANSVAVSDSYEFAFSNNGSVTASTMSIADGKTLTLSGTGTIGSAISGAGGVTVAADSTISFSGTNTFTGTATVNGTAILAGTTLSALGGNGNIAGSGSVALTLSGILGALDVSRLEGFTGELVFKAGASGNKRLGILKTSADKISSLSGIRVENGTQLYLCNWSDSTNNNLLGVLGTAVTIAGTGYGASENQAALRLNDGAELAGLLTLSADATVHVAKGAGSKSTISGGISAAGKTLTIAGSDTLDISGTANITIGTLTLTKSGDTNLSATGTTTINTLNGTGTLTVTETGSLTKTSDIMTVAGSAVLKSAGTVTLNRLTLSGTSSATVTGGTFAVSDEAEGLYVCGGATFTVEGGVATVGRLVLNSVGSPSDASANVSVTGGVLNVTRATAHGVVLGSYASTQPQVISVSGDGVFNANCAITMQYTSDGEINVSGNGEMNVKGLAFGIDGKTTAGTVNVTGGRLNIGSSGITPGTSSSGARSISFSNATIGALDSWSSASALGITLGGTVTFDTTKMVASTTGKSSADATDTEGTTITLNGVLSGDGALKKTGAGTLTLSNANIYTGGTVIEEGAVVAANANALGTTKGVEVKTDATLKLGTDAVTVAGLSGAGTVGLADGTTSSTLTVNGGGVFTGTLTGGGRNSLALVFDADGQTLELNPNLGNSLSSVEVKAGTVKTGNAFGFGYAPNVTVRTSGALEFTASEKNDYGLMLGGITFADGSSFVVDATGAAENDVLKIIMSSAIKYNSGTEELTLGVDGDLDDFVNDFVTLKGWDGLADWSYTDNTLSVTLTVPEPSAFGLLAGAGALALVAARRRRTKKA